MTLLLIIVFLLKLKSICNFVPNHFIIYIIMKRQSFFIICIITFLCSCNVNSNAQQLPITLQAENAKIVGSGPHVNTNGNWSAGEKFVENFSFGSSLEYENVQIARAGVYKFEIKYMTGDTNRPLAITVNGYDAMTARFTETTDHWNAPPTKTAVVYLHFDQGANSIKITPIKDYGPNLDKFIISESDKQVETNVYPYDFTDGADITAEDTNSSLNNLTDNDCNTIYTVSGKTSTKITIDCKQPVLLSGYLLSAGKNNVQNFTGWTVEYSADKQNWQTVTPNSTTENDYSSIFHITQNRTVARYYRLTATGNSSINIGEFQLFGIPYSENGNAFMPDLMSEVDVNTHTNATPAGIEGSTFLNLFDRDISTKYLGLNSETFMVTAETAQAKKLSYYTLTSCADAIERDLKSWKIEGYNGYEWETIHQVTDFLFPCRLTTMKFAVNTTKAYEAFRLRMDETNGSYNFQLVQWQIFGENGTKTSVAQTKWSKKKSPITTPWYDTIDPENVLGEYPRPQMVRENWMNLNGIWDFKESIGMGRYRANQLFDKQILVPFPIESALSGLMFDDHSERPYKTYLYQRKFTVPASLQKKNILLHFGAVDWKCEVYVNGILVGTHEGGYDPFYFDISSALKSAGEQELQVQFMDPSDAGGQPVGKQKINHGGIFYTPSSGIWQTVWLEGVNESYINNFTITPNIDKDRVSFNVKGTNANGSNVIVRIYDKGNLITEKEGQLGRDINISIEKPKLWSPASPFLYDVELELKNSGQTTDVVKSYFGMRKTSLGVVDGKACFMLNNERIFQHGPLDQGYWPDGLHTAPSDEALIFDIEQTKAFGFNMSRKHIKVEPARWYYHCDRLGLLVWQDMVNAGSDQNLLGDDEWVKANFIRESENVIRSLKNHPSIVSWIVFNEGFGQYANNSTHTQNAYNAVRRLDNTRVINSASGWVIFDNIGEVADMHSYPRPGIFKNPTSNRISVCGEYGGITLVVKNHIWKNSEMVYVSVNNSTELKDLFISYNDLLRPLQFDGLGGAVYTQLTDLEEEVNGLITYDRKVVKVTGSLKEQVKNAIKSLGNSSTVELVPTALRAKDTQWKYTTSTPTDSWNTLGFSDAAWSTGVSGFGAGDPPNTSYDNKSTINTNWSTSYIYLRKTFRCGDLTEELREGLRLTLYHDDDCEVYINGVLAFKATGYTSNYKKVDVSKEAKEALRANGNNVLAVKCRQYSGGQYIDAGLMMEYSLVETPPSSLASYENAANPFYLYPNPTNGDCQIKGNSAESVKSVKIFDMAGNKKKEFYSDNFNVHDLENGIYLAQVLTDNIFYPLKLIKN